MSEIQKKKSLKAGHSHYDYFCDHSMKKFAIVTDTLLVLTLITMCVGFVWSLVERESASAILTIRIGAILAFISTPIRLFLLAGFFRKDGNAKLGMATLGLLLVLALSAASKWFIK